MNTTKSKTGGETNGMARKAPTSSKVKHSGAYKSKMHSSQLMQLFEEELKDIYWAEKALTKAIPKMISNATSDRLIETLQGHLKETEEQVKRVEKVFELVGHKATAKKCEAMEGLINEAEEIMEACEEGAMRDAGIISAGQKIEHYEIASYGTLRQFAQTLGFTEAAELLQATLDEEKVADAQLTEVAVTAVNIEAEHEEVTSGK